MTYEEVLCWGEEVLVLTLITWRWSGCNWITWLGVLYERMKLLLLTLTPCVGRHLLRWREDLEVLLICRHRLSFIVVSCSVDRRELALRFAYSMV